MNRAPDRASVGVLFLTVLIDLLGFGIVLPLLPRYADVYKASGHEIGLLMASYSIMQFLVSPFWGRLSDRIGRRPVILIGLFGSVISYTLFGLADSMLVLFASRIAAGTFGATVGAAHAYIADTTTEAQRGRQMALIGIAFGVGFTVGPAVGGIAHSEDHTWLPGFIAAGLSLVAFLFAAARLREPESHKSRGRRTWFDIHAIKTALGTPTIPLILFLHFFTTVAFAQMEGTLSLLTKRKWGYDPSENGWLFAYVGFCILIAQGFVVRRFMHRVGERNFVCLGCALLVVGLIGVGVAEGTAQALGVLPIAVLGFAMIGPSLVSLLSRRTSPETQGEILGVNQSGLSLARIIGPYLGMVLLDVTTELPYWVAAGLMAVAFLGALALKRAPVPGAADS